MAARRRRWRRRLPSPTPDAPRVRYRSLSDAHQLIADNNVRLIQAGKQPTNEQLINEQRAAQAVELARKELLARIPTRD